MYCKTITSITIPRKELYVLAALVVEPGSCLSQILPSNLFPSILPRNHITDTEALTKDPPSHALHFISQRLSTLNSSSPQRFSIPKALEASHERLRTRYGEALVIGWHQLSDTERSRYRHQAKPCMWLSQHKIMPAVLHRRDKPLATISSSLQLSTHFV